MASGDSGCSRPASTSSRRAALVAAGLATIGSLLILPGCGRLVYADGPYRGQVLEAETRRPIEGAAVLAVWWKRSPADAQSRISFYDAQETLTDQSGTFTIPGITGGSLNPLATVKDPLFTIFKPGYEAYGDRALTPVGSAPTVVELRRLTTRDERSRNLDRLSFGRFCLPDDKADSCIPREKSPNLIRLRNAELRSLDR